MMKLKCVKSKTEAYTVGEVYTLVNGTVKCNEGYFPQCTGREDINHINRVVAGVKFEEVKENKMENRTKVKVINNELSYTTYSEMANDYKEYGKFEDFTKAKNGEILDLIEYAPHKAFGDREMVAVCLSKDGKIILIEREGVEEMKNEGILSKGTRVIIKGKTAFGSNLNYRKWANQRQFREEFENQRENGYNVLEGYDYEIGAYFICGNFYNRCDFDLYDEEPTLKAGDIIVLKEDKYGFTKGKRFEVTKVEGDTIEIKTGFGCGMMSMDEMKWFNIVEAKEEWSMWQYYSFGEEYRVKGNKVQWRDWDGNKGEARCHPDDMEYFDLKKGIEIAKNRAKIKKMEKELKELTK